MENKKFKILLVYPNIPGMLVLPGAIGIFTAILKKAGFELDLFDATLYEEDAPVSPLKRVEYLQARKFSYAKDLGFEMRKDLIGSFVKKVESFNPDLLLISVLEDAFLQGIRLLAAIKEKNIPHIVGGVFVTAASEKAISYPQIKMIGWGEGEKTVLELAQRMRNGEHYEDILNIPNTWVKKEDGTIIKNPIASLVDINRFMPDFSLFEKVRFYRPMGGKILKTIPLETARGCPYQCTFCDSPMWSKIYRDSKGEIFLRRKSIGRLMEEIRYFVAEYSPELLYIIDDTFLARPIEELKEFAESYQEFKIPFWMNTRPETITQEKGELLKKMNCYRMSIGVECGNEDFRKNKLKRFGSNKEILQSMEILSKSGIPFSINNMIGFPDENRELIFETIELNRQFSGYDSLTVSIFTPYHGSKLREEAIQKGYLDPEIMTTHTTASSLLDMPQLSKEAINGLMRTFTMYVGFPKKWREHIEKAEKFTPEGNAIFEKLKNIYHQVYFSGNQFQKHASSINWDELEKQLK
ncbi:MAG: radical SAM protein [Candidatus Nealsonbacteria bacterium]|nr:radical SAM protein [Candidatus Nealsonbacteria bacterium]